MVDALAKKFGWEPANVIKKVKSLASHVPPDKRKEVNNRILRELMLVDDWKSWIIGKAVPLLKEYGGKALDWACN